jgi:hypothetical protein
MGRGLDGYFCPSLALCGSQAPPGRGFARFPVAHSEGETPLPIPNRAVKPLSADGTWRATSWESRSPPVFHSTRAAISAALRRLWAPQEWVANRLMAASQAPVLRAFRRVRTSQGRGAGLTGSSPYSPSVAKSITRSTASAARVAICALFVSNMSSQSTVVRGRLPDPARVLAVRRGSGHVFRPLAARRSRERAPR